MKYELLNKLIHNLMSTTEFQSGKDLAFSLGTSEKTTLKYINILKEQLKNNGAEVEIRQGYGSRLVITNHDKFDQYLKTFEKQENGILNNPETRRSYVLMRLLTTSDYIDLYSLADELYISPSLLRSILRNIKSIAEQYNLKLINSHRDGYRIIGDEAAIRRCLSQECRHINDVSKSFHRSENTDEFNIIQNIIDKELGHFGLVLSSSAVNSLTVHIMIAINRYETKHPIELENTFDLLKIKGSPEYFLASRISRELKKQLNVKLPDNEVIYFAMHINGKQRAQHELLHTNVSVDDMVFYNKFIRNIYRLADVDFFEDNELRASLLNHIVPFRNRVKNNMQINRTDLENIRNQFPYAYELALYGLSMYPEGKITPSETAYFSLHLELALEKHAHPEKKYNITVISDDVTSMYQIISFKLNQHFSHQIDMLMFASPKEIKENYSAYMDRTDLFLNLTDQKTDYPIKTISASEFLTEQELQDIAKAFHILDAEDRMNNLLKNCIFMRLHASTRDEAIDKIIARTKDNVPLPDDFKERILERENMGTTEFNNQVAVPHPLKNEDIPDFLTIACLEKPILWEKKEVSLIFMLSASSSASSWFMEQIAKIIQSPHSVKTLLECRDIRSFLRIFLSI